MCFSFFKQKTSYEMRISDWGSVVCSSDRALVGGQLGAAGQLAELGPVLPALEAGERHEAVVARLVDVDEGVASRVVALRHAPRHAEQVGQRDRLAHGPQPGAEQRHVDRGGCARLPGVDKDRKGRVWGKRIYVGVGSGGCRYIKKKK